MWLLNLFRKIRQPRYIVTLPRHDYIVGIMNWRGRLMITGASGTLYELEPVDGDQEYMLKTLGFMREPFDI